MNSSKFEGVTSSAGAELYNPRTREQGPLKSDRNVIVPGHLSNKDEKVDGGGRHSANKHMDFDSHSEADFRLFSARIDDYKLSRPADKTSQNFGTSHGKNGIILHEIQV